MSLKLLDGVTSDTVGQYFKSKGYQSMLLIDGDLDSGAVTIEILGPLGGDLPIQDKDQTDINSFTVVGVISTFSIPAGVSVKASLAGKTNTNPVSVHLF